MLAKIFQMFVVFALGTTINLGTLDNNAVIYAKGEDSIQATELTLVDGETEKAITEFPYKLNELAEKTYTLKSGEKTFTLHVDNTAPVITVAGVENDKTYKKAHVKVTIDGAKSQTIKLNNQDKSTEFDVTENGDYTLKVTAEDEAGNTSEKEVKFKIYNTDPVITVTGIEKTIQNTDYNITVNVTSEFPVTSEIKLDGNVVTSPITVSAEGKHTLTVTAEDQLGNTASYSKDFEIDKTAPVVTVEGIDKASYNTDVHYKVTGADTIKLNGSDAPAENTLTQELSYTLVASATDAAGNTTTVTKQFRIKRAAPEIAITGIDKADFNTAVNYSVTTDDATLVVKLDGCEVPATGTVSATGHYELTARAEDDAGNYSTAEKSFTIDTDKPTITIDGITEGAFYSASVQYKVETRDNDPLSRPTTDTVTMDGVEVNKTGQVTEEGPHTIVVTSTDACGNVATETRHFTIDYTEPQVTFNDVQYVNDLRKVVATATDANLNNITLEADFGDKTFTNTGLPEVRLSKDDTAISVNDKWDFFATATDKAGNEGHARKTVYRDTTDPKIIFTKVAKHINQDVDFTAQTEDANPQNITVKIKRGNTETKDSGEKSVTKKLTAEGTYVIHAKSTDKAGNVSEKEMSFTIDKTKPNVSISAPKGYNRSASEVTVHSNEEGTTYMKVMRDKKVIFNGKGSSFSKLGRDGEYKVTAYAVDLAGNKSKTKTASFVIDSTKPDISLSGVRDGAYYNKAVNITASCKERFYKNTKVTITIKAVKGENISFPFNCSKETTKITKTISANGTYKIKMVARDAAGNTASTKEYTFTVDTKKPEITITAPEKGRYDAVIAPKVEIKDENFKSKTITLTKSEGKTFRDSFGKTGGTRTYSDFKKVKTNDGVYTLTATAVDKAGNTATDSKTFTVNRFGSTFKTMTKPDEYGQETKTNVVVREKNLSGIKSFKCTVIRDAEETKAEGVTVKEEDKSSTYTIPSSNFGKEGVYRVRIETVDNAGNTSRYESDFAFTIDKTPPVITYTGVESGKVYKENNVRMYVSAKDSLTKQPKITVTVNGRKTNLEKDEKGTYATIGNGYNQTIVITATDKAGNASNVKVDKVSVSTNKLAFFISHKLLTVALIAGVAVAAILAAVLFARKKKDEDEDKGDDIIL